MGESIEGLFLVVSGIFVYFILWRTAGPFFKSVPESWDPDPEGKQGYGLDSCFGFLEASGDRKKNKDKGTYQAKTGSAVFSFQASEASIHCGGFFSVWRYSVVPFPVYLGYQCGRWKEIHRGTNS